MQRPLFLTALLTSACMSQPFTDDALLQEWPEPVSLDDAIPGQWIVAVEGGGHPADSALAAGALTQLGAGEWEQILPGTFDQGLADAWRFTTDEDPQVVLDGLVGRVAWLEPDRLITASATAPDDPLYSYQWHLEAIGLPAAWDAGVGEGVTVAVLDTGVSAGPDGFTNLLAGIDTVGDGDGAEDYDGHGTHVAGTIAQATRNGYGTAGVAPGVNLLPVQVLGRGGAGSAVSVARGIVAAVDAGADVLNMSLGTGASSRVIEQAVDYAVDRGVVVVAASGNAGWSRVDWPAADPDVIAVGAVGATGARAPYSNGGTALDLVAPGGDLSRDANGDGYADGVLQETLGRGGFTFSFFEGTSMAAPHVAGVAALLVAQVGRDPERIRSLLVGTAVDLDAPGWDAGTGAGLLDAEAAVAAALGTTPDEDTDTDPRDEPEPEPETTAKVVLSEVMIDPVTYDDTEAEYIELWNTGDEPVALTRLALFDADGNGGDLIGDGVIEPGAVVVIARDVAADWPWAGVPLNGLYPSRLSLNNGSDSITLRLDGEAVDGVSWSSAPRGTAAELVGEDWLLSTTRIPGTSDFGTPGQRAR